MARRPMRGQKGFTTDFNEQRFKSEILAQLVQNGALQFEQEYVRKLTPRLQKSADRALDDIFREMSRLIGRRSAEQGYKPAMLRFMPFGPLTGLQTLTFADAARMQQAEMRIGSVVWKPLAPATRRRKGHGMFYKDTGKLKSQLAALSGVQKYGSAQVQWVSSKRFKVTGKQVEVGQFRIRLFPKVSSSTLQKILAGDYWGVEPPGQLGSSTRASVRTKLAGPKGFGGARKRPFLEPFIHYYLTTRIPIALGRALQRAKQVKL